MPEFLHEHKDFAGLISLVVDQMRIDPALVEKDYWIMHCLWGLQAQGYVFELKGGTSLSKGFGIIDRFSEDIDIRIEPPAGTDVKTGRNHNKPAHIESRQEFYDRLASEIRIPGIIAVERDRQFDDAKYRSGGIRLLYRSDAAALQGLKSGILLEAGFDDTAPNRPVTISSWAYETASKSNVNVADNRAVGVPCYAPTHTFVEKLQTISTKYRQWAESSVLPVNFLRHYYDVYSLLKLPEVQEYMGTDAYEIRKTQRFRGGDELVIANNPAFTLTDPEVRKLFTAKYQETKDLYYAGQPLFEELLAEIGKHIRRM